MLAPRLLALLLLVAAAAAAGARGAAVHRRGRESPEDAVARAGAQEAEHAAKKEAREAPPADVPLLKGPDGQPANPRLGYMLNGRIVPPRTGGTFANSMGHTHNVVGGLPNFLRHVRRTVGELGTGGVLHDPALSPNAADMVRLEREVYLNANALDGRDLRRLERAEASKKNAVKVA